MEAITLYHENAEAIFVMHFLRIEDAIQEAIEIMKTNARIHYLELNEEEARKSLSLNHAYINGYEDVYRITTK